MQKIGLEQCRIRGINMKAMKNSLLLKDKGIVIKNLPQERPVSCQYKNRPGLSKCSAAADFNSELFITD